MSRLLIACLLVVFLIPGFIWYGQTGDLSVYFSESAPDGQFLYVLSKLVGMYALLLISWQIIITLLTRLGIMHFQWRGATHRLFGVFVVVLALTHLLLFFTAVSLRQDAPALGMFLPNFKDFYHTHLTFGLLGLWVLFAVLASGLDRYRKNTSHSRLLHKGYWVSIALVYFHALAVGTESQSKVGLIFYSALGILVLLLLVIWLISQGKTRLGYSI
ncbi:MAG: hypothetical protein ABW168_21665 [Sedimenticola sp.]